MGVDISLWREADHPRDRLGRFRSKWGISGPAKELLDSILDGFNARQFSSPQEAQRYLSQRFHGYTPEQNKAMREYLHNFKAIDAEMQAGKVSPESAAMKSMMRPLPDDLMLTQSVPPSAFGLDGPSLPVVEEATGKLIKNKSFGNFWLGGGANNGGIVLHLLAPRGTKVAHPGGAEVMLDDNANIRVTRVEEDGRGGYRIYAVAVPGDGKGGDREGTSAVQAVREGFKEGNEEAAQAPGTPQATEVLPDVTPEAIPERLPARGSSGDPGEAPTPKVTDTLAGQPGREANGRASWVSASGQPITIGRGRGPGEIGVWEGKELVANSPDMDMLPQVAANYPEVARWAKANRRLTNDRLASSAKAAADDARAKRGGNDDHDYTPDQEYKPGPAPVKKAARRLHQSEAAQKEMDARSRMHADDRAKKAADGAPEEKLATVTPIKRVAKTTPVGDLDRRIAEDKAAARKAPSPVERKELPPVEKPAKKATVTPIRKATTPPESAPEREKLATVTPIKKAAPKPVAPVKKAVKRVPKGEFKADDVSAKLDAAEGRDEARQALEGLTVAQLKEVAAKQKMPLRPGDRKKDHLVNSLVNFGPGSRADSKAIKDVFEEDRRARAAKQDEPPRPPTKTAPGVPDIRDARGRRAPGEEGKNQGRNVPKGERDVTSLEDRRAAMAAKKAAPKKPLHSGPEAEAEADARARTIADARAKGGPDAPLTEQEAKDRAAAARRQLAKAAPVKKAAKAAAPTARVGTRSLQSGDKVHVQEGADGALFPTTRKTGIKTITIDDVTPEAKEGSAASRRTRQRYLVTGTDENGNKVSLGIYDPSQRWSKLDGDTPEASKVDAPAPVKKVAAPTKVAKRAAKIAPTEKADRAERRRTEAATAKESKAASAAAKKAEAANARDAAKREKDAAAGKALSDQWLERAGLKESDLSEQEKAGMRLMAEKVAAKEISRPEAMRRLRSDTDPDSSLSRIGRAITARKALAPKKAAPAKAAKKAAPKTLGEGLKGQDPEEFRTDLAKKMKAEGLDVGPLEGKTSEEIFDDALAKTVRQALEQNPNLKKLKPEERERLIGKLTEQVGDVQKSAPDVPAPAKAVKKAAKKVAPKLPPSHQFREGDAKPFKARPEKKTARLVTEAPDGHKIGPKEETILSVPQWGDGATQKFVGPYYEIDEIDGSGKYGSAKAEFEDMHERIPGQKDGWLKTANVDAYQYHGPEVPLETVLKDGTKEVSVGADGKPKMLKDGQWVTRQKGGEVQAVDDAKFRKLYDTDAKPAPAAPGEGAKLDEKAAKKAAADARAEELTRKMNALKAKREGGAAKATPAAAPAKAAPTPPSADEKALRKEDMDSRVIDDQMDSTAAAVERNLANGGSPRAVSARVRTDMKKHRLFPDADGKSYTWKREGQPDVKITPSANPTDADPDIRAARKMAHLATGSEAIANSDGTPAEKVKRLKDLRAEIGNTGPKSQLAKKAAKAAAPRPATPKSEPIKAESTPDTPLERGKLFSRLATQSGAGEQHTSAAADARAEARNAFRNGEDPAAIARRLQAKADDIGKGNAGDMLAPDADLTPDGIRDRQREDAMSLKRIANALMQHKLDNASLKKAAPGAPAKKAVKVAKKAAPTGGTLAPARKAAPGPARDAQVDNAIRQAYRQAIADQAPGPFGPSRDGRERKHGDYVMLDDIRSRVGDKASREEVDAALKRFAREGDVQPQEAQGHLTPSQRAASIKRGSTDLHMISLQDPADKEFTPAKKVAKAAPTGGAASPKAYDGLKADLAKATTVDGARDMLTTRVRGKAEHRALADSLGVELAPNDTIAQMRDKILRQTVTARLTHDAYMRRANPVSSTPGSSKIDPTKKSSKPITEDSWGGRGTDVSFHDDGTIGMGLRRMDAGDRTIDVDGEPLENVLGKIATDTVRGRTTSKQQVAELKKLRDRFPEGSSARQALSKMVQELDKPGAPLPNIPEGTPAPLRKLAQQLHDIPLTGADPLGRGRDHTDEMDGLKKIMEDIAAGVWDNRSTGILAEELMRKTHNKRHESKEGKLELDRAIEAAAAAIRAMGKKFTRE